MQQHGHQGTHQTHQPGHQPPQEGTPDATLLRHFPRRTRRQQVHLKNTFQSVFTDLINLTDMFNRINWHRIQTSTIHSRLCSCTTSMLRQVLTFLTLSNSVWRCSVSPNRNTRQVTRYAKTNNKPGTIYTNTRLPGHHWFSSWPAIHRALDRHNIHLQYWYYINVYK